MTKKEIEVKEKLKKLTITLNINSIKELIYYNADNKKGSLLLLDENCIETNILSYFDLLKHDNIKVELYSYSNINNCTHYKVQVLDEHFKKNYTYIKMLLK